MPGCALTASVCKSTFFKVICLHPDGFEDADSGWPRVLKRFAAERRADAGELADEELYPSDAQWSGLYDRMFPHKPDEMERRLALAADYGEAI
jgi:hypothetical protein